MSEQLGTVSVSVPNTREVTLWEATERALELARAEGAVLIAPAELLTSYGMPGTASLRWRMVR